MQKIAQKWKWSVIIISKKLVNFKLDPLTIVQLNKLSENQTKVSVVENSIDTVFELDKKVQTSKPNEPLKVYLKKINGKWIIC